MYNFPKWNKWVIHVAKRILIILKIKLFMFRMLKIAPAEISRSEMKLQ